jgi:Mg2+-importing ATPase
MAKRSLTPTTADTTPAEWLLELSRMPADEVLAKLASSRLGLSDEEVHARRERWGINEIAHERPPRWYALLLHAFANPFNLVLTTLASLSWLTGDREGVYVIVAMVLLSTLLRFAQEFRSQQAAGALRLAVRTSATVERDGDDFPVGTTPAARRRDVPMQELVPGDLIYLSAGDMVPADVRLLSAKDLFVSQSAVTGESLPVEKFDSPPVMTPGAAAPEMPTVCFMGTNVVSGTASAVVVNTGSRTATGSMARGLLTRRAATAFDAGVQQVSWLLIRFMLVMVPIVIVINGLTKGNWLEALLFGLAVAVGLTPEMLPMVVTANLAKGAVTMARHKTIVKRLDAIQNFGAMDVLCTDKTGTLTQDHIVLERHLNVVGEEDDEVLELAYLNSYYQTGLKNLLDVAVLEHGELHAELAVDKSYRKVDEIPFDFVRRRMSVVVDHEGRHHQLICKGAAEEMLAACRWVRDEHRLEPLDAARRDVADDVIAELNGDGFRVVAVAYRDFAPRTTPYTVQDESELILAGFIGFLDPPKESAGPALRAFAQHGVTVKVLTGDNELVTRKVCHDVGFEAGHILLGQDIRALDGAALADAVDRTAVFAKMTPDDKVRVVKALRARGHTVGFLGDGINDAGALRAADVGISVDTAVDVAKESADLILLEKSLMVLEEGLIEGRKTFGNTIKYIKMAASSNFGNVFSVLAASAFLPFLPMLPAQMLIQNLLYDFSQAAIPFDNMDAEWLRRPRAWKANDIGRFMLFIGPISSVFDITTFMVLWWVFGANGPEHASFFQSGWFVEGLASQTLIVHMIRTARVPFLQSRASLAVQLTTAAVILSGIALPFTSFGASLGMTTLPWTYFPFLLIILFSYALLTQLVKQWYMRKFEAWL